jgi:hypothetical protein
MGAVAFQLWTPLLSDVCVKVQDHYPSVTWEQSKEKTTWRSLIEARIIQPYHQIYQDIYHKSVADQRVA